MFPVLSVLTFCFDRERRGVFERIVSTTSSDQQITSELECAATYLSRVPNIGFHPATLKDLVSAAENGSTKTVIEEQLPNVSAAEISSTEKGVSTVVVFFTTGWGKTVIEASSASTVPILIQSQALREAYKATQDFYFL